MATIKEYREFFLRATQVLAGLKPDKEANFPTTLMVDGQARGNRFLKGHYPSEEVMKKFLESVAFHLNPESTGTETLQGLFKWATQAQFDASTDVDADNINLVPRPSFIQTLFASASDSPYIYIGFADKSDGTGYTATFDATKIYWAIRTSATDLGTINAATFAGLWRRQLGSRVLYHTSVDASTTAAAGEESLGSYNWGDGIFENVGDKIKVKAVVFADNTASTKTIHVYFGQQTLGANYRVVQYSGPSLINKTVIINLEIERVGTANQDMSVRLLQTPTTLGGGISIPPTILTDTGSNVAWFERTNNLATASHKYIEVFGDAGNGELTLKSLTVEEVVK